MLSKSGGTIPKNPSENDRLFGDMVLVVPRKKGEGQRHPEEVQKLLEKIMASGIIDLTATMKCGLTNENNSDFCGHRSLQLTLLLSLTNAAGHRRTPGIPEKLFVQYLAKGRIT